MPTEEQFLSLIKEAATNAAEVRAELRSVDGRLKSLEVEAKETNGLLSKLVDLGVAKDVREKEEHASRIARQRASEEAEAIAVNASINGSKAWGDWVRQTAREVVMPFVPPLVVLAGAYAAGLLGQPAPSAPQTQVVTVEAPRQDPPMPMPRPDPPMPRPTADTPVAPFRRSDIILRDP